MRIILDTNVLLSGLLIAHGAPTKLLDAWERSRFTLVSCKDLITEFREVASRPFFKAKLRASAVELLAAGLGDFSLFCDDLPPGPVAPDPKDSYLLALGEASAADFLVTGDKALQSLKRHKSTRIVSPSAMMYFLKEADEGREE
ncbi:MAG TPA: putative toxin-antitoxin system toxin component, PIN family [Terriglobales bacterium]|nr:putative toxin-antitoxin system toxin component, PIN family [Terriglobales bacterium]